MNSDETIGEVASMYGLSFGEASEIFDNIARIFEGIGAGFEKAVDMLKEKFELIKDAYQEYIDRSKKGKPTQMTLLEFIVIMNEAHRLAIEEEKKPPDCNQKSNQADSAGKVMVQHLAQDVLNVFLFCPKLDLHGCL